MLFRVEAGNAGIELNDGTMRVKVGGTWYYVKRTYDSNAGKYFLELSASA
jgi:hypothetical protein